MMKKGLLMLIMSVFILSSCDPEYWYQDFPEIEPDIEVDIDVDVTVNKDSSYTFNGVNLKYKIENIVPEVGESIRISMDSESEVKPYVRLLINEEEVMGTSDLPAVYTTIAEIEGEHPVEFQAYDADKNLLFTLKESISVVD